MSIGNRIYELRTGKNLSQGDLAEKLDVSRQSVSKWETDSSVPELDKLMKLCDVFDVSLDELTERSNNHDTEHCEKAKVVPTASFTQKLFGIMFLGLSLLVGFLSVLLLGADDMLLLFIPLSLTLLACSIICFTIKKRALYWCAWTGLSSISVLTSHLLGGGILSGFKIIQLVGMITMGIASVKLFKNTVVSVSLKKSVLQIIGWAVIVALYFMSLCYSFPLWTLSAIFNYAVFALIAALETYTICYIKSLKK